MKWEGDVTNKNLFFNNSLACENRIYQDTLGTHRLQYSTQKTPEQTKARVFTRRRLQRICGVLVERAFYEKYQLFVREKLDFHMWRYSCTFGKKQFGLFTQYGKMLNKVCSWRCGMELNCVRLGWCCRDDMQKSLGHEWVKSSDEDKEECNEFCKSEHII